MSQFYSCRSHAPETGHGIAAARHGRKIRTVDIHCHLVDPAAESLMQPHFTPDKEPTMKYSSAASREVNRLQMQNVRPHLTDLAQRLRDMDRLGIDIQAISPAPTQYYYWADADLGRQVSRLINDGIAETVARQPDRLVGLGTVPLQAPELAVMELKRCVGELGLRGIEISTNVTGQDLADPKFRPFFAAAAELDVLIFMHPLGFTQGERLSEHYFNNVIGNPLESTIAVGHLIFGGVLDRHPGLKICIAHGGGYLPAYAGRMDHAFHARSDCRAHIPEPPSHYLKRLYFDTVVFDPDQLAYLAAKYGADHVLLGSDYPFDMGEVDPVGFVTANGRLSEADREAILGGNARRLLKLA